jgi:hypothetical protein
LENLKEKTTWETKLMEEKIRIDIQEIKRLDSIRMHWIEMAGYGKTQHLTPAVC